MILYKFNISTGELEQTDVDIGNESYNASTREMLLRALGYKESVAEAYNLFTIYYTNRQSHLIEQKKYLEKDIDDLYRVFDKVSEIIKLKDITDE